MQHGNRQIRNFGEQLAYIPTIFQLCFQTLSDCFLFLRILPECFSFVKKEMFLTA